MEPSPSGALTPAFGDGKKGEHAAFLFSCKILCVRRVCRETAAQRPKLFEHHFTKIILVYIICVRSRMHYNVFLLMTSLIFLYWPTMFFKFLPVPSVFPG